LFSGAYPFGKACGDDWRSKTSLWGRGKEQLDKRSLDIIVDDALRFSRILSRHIDETRRSYLTKTRKW
jgi:hypothetical protein